MRVISLKDNYTFIVFSPDAVEQKLVYPILNFLEEEHGICAVKLKYLNINLRQLERLYQEQIKKMSPNWWLVEKLFSLGRSIAVLLHNEHSSTDLSEYITAIKGKSDPTVCSTDSIRGKFGAENRFINLIHTPDNHDRCKEEINIFFTPIEIEESRLRPNLSLLDENNGHSNLLDFYATLSRVKRRILYLFTQEEQSEYHESLAKLFVEEYNFQLKQFKGNSDRLVISETYKELLMHQKEFISNIEDEHDLFLLLKKLVLLPFYHEINIYEEYEQKKYSWGPFLTEWEMLTLQSGVTKPINLLFGGVNS